MRADRLLSILLLLQVHRRMTARELAQRLEVSPRTIHRDMEALSGAGVPLVAERGAGGGWALLENYQTNLTGLNGAEILTLFLPKPAHLLNDLGLRRAYEDALIKLFAALPSIARRGAEQARQRIHIDATGWRYAPESVAALPVLQEATWQERKVRIVYQRADETVVARIVDPLGLVAKGNVWYMVAAVDGEPRTYRVSRVQEAAMTDEPCLRPPEFDLAAYWEQSSADFKARLPQHPAILRVASTALPRLRTISLGAHVEHIEEPDAEGWLRVAMVFDTEEVACEVALGLGPSVEVLEPQPLRENVIRLAAGIIERYAQTVLP